MRLGEVKGEWAETATNLQGVAQALLQRNPLPQRGTRFAGTPFTAFSITSVSTCFRTGGSARTAASLVMRMGLLLQRVCNAS